MARFDRTVPSHTHPLKGKHDTTFCGTNSECSIATAFRHHIFSLGFCTFTQSVRIAFDSSNIPYTFTFWSDSDPSLERFTTVSPGKTIPVLKLSDGSYTNSSPYIFQIAGG